MTNKDRVTAAFKALRKQGFAAHQNWTCCQSCGNAALTERYGSDLVNYAFYHSQDRDAFLKNDRIDGLCLSWGGDGPAIVRALEAEGLRVEWDGTEEQRIAVYSR